MSRSTWISLEKLPVPSMGVSSVSTAGAACPQDAPAFDAVIVPRTSARQQMALLVDHLDCIDRQAATDPATRLTIAVTWLSDNWRPWPA
jgi:hypothetical protein